MISIALMVRWFSTPMAPQRALVIFVQWTYKNGEARFGPLDDFIYFVQWTEKFHVQWTRFETEEKSSGRNDFLVQRTRKTVMSTGPLVQWTDLL